MSAPRLALSGFLDIGGQRLEYRLTGPPPSDAPCLVLLHEGLGCAGLWGDFPERLRAATGASVFAYSRAGYGASSPAALPRQADYMHREALDVLPRVLEAIGFERGMLIGHSDGASIAAIYAGGVEDHRLRGLVLIAPHFIVEDISIQGIEAARAAYAQGGLREKLARWHANPDNAFRGWNDIWLSPEFRSWDICESLAYIRVPVQIVQGMADQYGSPRQIEIAREECYCPLEVVLLEGIGHAPQREAPEEALAAVAGFVNHLLVTHGEGRVRPIR
jgi:pimeloyl-ACP methyl ester carboxylesterase